MNERLHEVYRLDDAIRLSKNNNVTLQTTSLFSKVGKNVVFAFSNIVDKYYSVIQANLIRIKLNEEEFKKYKYNPHRLSLDLYGTTELWFMILKVNKIMSSSDFTESELYILHPNELTTINQIIVKETEALEANRIQLGV